MTTIIPYCTGMVTTGRPRGYLYIAERMAALDPPIDDTELGRRMGAHRVTALRYRDPAEQHRFNIEKLLRLAEALECDVPDLFLPPGQVTMVVDISGKVAKRR